MLRIRRVKRWALTATIAAGVLVAALAGPAAVAKPGGGTSSHKVEMTWRPKAQDIVPNSPEVLDDFITHGRPFGDDVLLTTITPRSQIGTDRRAGEWTLFIQPKRNGRCFGSFDFDRDVIETTETSQTVRYSGTVRIDRCIRTTRFNGVRAGRLGKAEGESLCTASGCRGGIEITGSVRY